MNPSSVARRESVDISGVYESMRERLPLGARDQVARYTVRLMSPQFVRSCRRGDNDPNDAPGRNPHAVAKSLLLAVFVLSSLTLAGLGYAAESIEGRVLGAGAPITRS